MRHLFLVRLALLLLAVGLFAQEQGDLTQTLAASRQRIDRIDDQIVKLLKERATVVRDVGLLKQRFHAPAAAPGRREEVLLRLSSEAQAPLTPDAVRRIYETVISEMTTLEEREMKRAQH